MPNCDQKKFMVRWPGFEPGPAAWQAAVLGQARLPPHNPLIIKSGWVYKVFASKLYKEHLKKPSGCPGGLVWIGREAADLEVRGSNPRRGAILKRLQG